MTYDDVNYDSDKQGHLLDRIFKLQQENAELKASVKSLEQSRKDLKRNNNQLENHLRAFANGESIAKIKAEAIREVVRIYLDASDSALDKADKLEQDNE